MFQPCRTTFFERLIQHKPAFVVHVVIKIDIRTYHLIPQYKPTYLRQTITIRFRVDDHDMRRQRSLKQTFDGIFAEACCFYYLCLRQTFFMIMHHLQNAVFDHQPADLENHRTPRIQMRQLLRLLRIERLLAKRFF